MLMFPMTSGGRSPCSGPPAVRWFPAGSLLVFLHWPLDPLQLLLCLLSSHDLCFGTWVVHVTSRKTVPLAVISTGKE